MALASATPEPVLVDHPLWSRFLRWCTIRPKLLQMQHSNSLTVQSIDTGAQLAEFQQYEYIPLPDPLTFIRLATILPGEFDDEIGVRLDAHMLIPPPKTRPERLTLAAIRKALPAGWEAFQTIIDNRMFFRETATGHVQWKHPDPGFHIEDYQLPPRNEGVVPRYETVSYVWGNTEKSEIIRVDGPNGSSKLHVTQSLSTVLRYLRYPGQTRTLWIDAICLNQSDYVELRQQVPRMYEIYRLAWMSTLWLGLEDRTSTHAMKSLRYLGSQIVAEADTGVLFAAPNAEEKEWYDPNFELQLPAETWDAVRTLMKRPWFNRIWVVQEIQPGAVVQCGHERVAVAMFAEAVYCLYSKTKLPEGLRPHFEQATGTLARLPALCFTRLIHRVATFKACTDPRDKIYGLLGLAPPKFAHSVRVDYEKTNTPSDVYAMAILNHAQITQRFEHFHNCFVGDGNKITEDAPSWVPDWYTDVPGEAYIPAQFATNTARAHYTVDYVEGTSPGNKTRPVAIRALAVQCGAVTTKTEPLPILQDKMAAIKHIRKWQPDDMDTVTYAPTGESLRKAYAITLICHVLKEREPDWILSSTEEWIKQDFGNQSLFGPSAGSLSGVEGDAGASIRTDVANALQLCADRLFFQTDEGYIGLGPAETQPGDVVGILLGCSTPLMLRPSDRGPEHFTIVGECFVHGVSDATKLLGPLPEPWIGYAAWIDGDRRCLRFLNTKTRQTTQEDPRLERLVGWERTSNLIDGDDPTLFDYFKNVETGEVINYDPRLEPDELRERGVDLKEIALL